MSQLALDLSFAPRFGADDFLVAPSNADAHALLTRWPDWPARVLLLVGPEGAGKSHLGAIWAASAGARTLGAADTQPGRLNSIVESALLVEDADRLQDAEAAMFHLLNSVRERQQFLLLTAQAAPDHWALSTPDLLSRLRLAPLLHLHAPDDSLLRAVLVKLFVDRQLTVDHGVVEFLTLHLDRSLGAARRLVDALDHASLASHRRITRPIAGEVLASLAA